MDGKETRGGLLSSEGQDGPSQKEGLLFCEQKRSKKNFARLDRAGFTASGPMSKSFLLLFFKKEALPWRAASLGNIADA
jgi:hypothetical protein